MSISIRPTSPLARRASALSVLAVVGALSLTACGDDEAPAAEKPSGSSTAAAADGQPRVPGVSGKVAAVSGGVAQVQGSDGQVAVSLGDATVTTERSAALSDVAKGHCVVVSFGSGSGSSSDADRASDDAPATSVSISDPVDGECSPFGGGRGPGRGGPGNGGPGGDGERPEMPEGAEPPAGGAMPEMPEGAEPPGDGERPEGRRPGGGRVTGTVTAVSSQGFTVEVTAMPTPPQGASAGASTGPEVDVERTVVVDGDTTYSRTVTGSAKDVTEGRCIMATGEEDETGGMEAETVRVSDAVDGECRSGFRPGNGGGRR